MKTFILMTALALTLAFIRPAKADVLTLFSGFVVWTETAQFIDDHIVIDGSGDGNSTLGTFTYTFHAEVDPVTGQGKERAQVTFANGDTWKTTGIGQGDNTGVGAVAHVTDIHQVKMATGQFAGQVGDFTVDRLVDLVTGNSRGSIHGEFIKSE